MNHSAPSSPQRGNRPSVEWGARINCQEPGCEKSLTVWDSKGTPTMPFNGGGPPLSARGWFVLYRQGGGHFAPADFTRGHVIYCTEHAEPAQAWFRAFSLWLGEKAKMVKAAGAEAEATRCGLCNRVGVFLNPPEYPSKRQVEQQAAVAFIEKNPAPVPPWKR